MTGDASSGQGQRWHDNRGELSRAVELLEAIPPEIRHYIAEALMGKADKDFNAGEILTSLKSLGKDKIMALHQSRKKRRSYDQDPNLHQIVNTFFVLPEDAQEGLAATFLEFTDLMVDYMANCDLFGQEPNPTDLQEMRTRFVEEGPLAVRNYLAEIHEELYRILHTEEAPNTPANSPNVALPVQVDDGMKVKKIQPGD